MLGLGKVASGLKGVLIELSERAIFYRERKFENHLNLIAKSLPILEQIAAMERANSISPERAELLRSVIVERVRILGAVTRTG